MLAPRPRNPALPGDQGDRTGTAGILRRARAEIRRRFDSLLREVLAIFNGIPVLAANDVRARTFYQLTPEQLSALSAALQAALDRWIASGRESATLFWWSPFVAEAVQLGTAQTAANLRNVSSQYAAARSLQQVVMSQPYVSRLAMAQTKSYEHWTGLSQGLRSELAELIGRAVIDGKNPRAVRTEIAERLGVSKSRALGYAQTDITDSLRQARVAEKDAAEDELGIRLGLLWTSALKPTTRPTHAARNGKVYTSAEVREFYSRDGNRYRCHCSVTECLLDEDGKPILTKELRSTMAAARAAWQRQYGER